MTPKHIVFRVNDEPNAEKLSFPDDSRKYHLVITKEIIDGDPVWYGDVTDETPYPIAHDFSFFGIKDLSEWLRDRLYKIGYDAEFVFKEEKE